MTVDSVGERQGLLHYRCGSLDIPESELCSAISFDRPDQRLAQGQVDSLELFQLRREALKQQHQRRKSKVRGFVGARIDLLPHQLYVAPEVAGRLVPRVLLADEVGLGKTIESCLILHRLLQTGRVRRALILVPEPLIHQWFVELLRRFNLWFRLFDEERCEAIQTSQPDANPFLDDQLILAPLPWLAGNANRAHEAVSAGWDILVVDEAHHLGWSPVQPSPEYAMVEQLSRATPALLLLTATPEQLGVESHFARLRLLDPDRYNQLDEFIAESSHYQEVARIAESLLASSSIDSAHSANLARVLAREPDDVRSALERIAQGDQALRQELVEDLLDQHGTGRVMFRNTRHVLSGFPARIARLHSLTPPSAAAELFEQLAAEFAADLDPSGAVSSAHTFNLAADPRIAWLADLLRQLRGEKVLLICRTRQKVEAIDAALRCRINSNMAVFHEGLALVQRDRNAAWFAEEDGAGLLLCSEIGSEGRNFQFAHHLILFDLPLDPELLEQRVGRLDRIGQREAIQIHLPFIPGSSQEVMVRWVHEGLNAIETHLRGGHVLLEQFGPRVRDLAQDYHETLPDSKAVLDQLIEQTKAARQSLAEQLEQGRDRLLELSSFRPEFANQVIQEIRRADQDTALDAFMLEVFDHYGVQVEELGQRTYRLGSAGVFADSFPGLPASGILATCDRRRALEREDVQFLTWDHPLVTGALDMLLGSTAGNSSFAWWPDSRTQALYLETACIAECIAPATLHIDRFLPPTPILVAVDQLQQDAATLLRPMAAAGKLKSGNSNRILHQPGFRDELLPELLAAALALAKQRMAPVIADARAAMRKQLHHEIARLRELLKVNRNVRLDEIERLEQQQDELDTHLASARLRLDAVRLVYRGPG